MAQKIIQLQTRKDPQLTIEKLMGRVQELEDTQQRVEASAADTVAMAEDLLIARNEAQTAQNEAETALKKAQEYEQTIREMALQDPLTGLANRNEFQRRLENALKLARREGNFVALMLLDLDHFKEVNDSFGHPVGDGLLKFVSVQLAKATRETDTVARLGGDEFAVIMPNVNDLTRVALVAERIIRDLSQPVTLSGSMVQSGTSIGIGLYPRDGKDIEGLFKTTDQALYEAKREGRDRYRFFDEAINEKSKAERILENDLRLAIVRDEFLLHYQPQFLATNNDIIGVEALIRWQHPTRGLVAPGDFIDAAEHSGLMCDIGRKVISAVCEQGNAWEEAGLPPFQLAANVSPQQFREDEFVPMVKNILDQTGFDPKRLELEITESVMMENVDQAIEKLNCLRELGISLSIDDFGTGYSSLAYLKQFPIQKLKIDQSFTQNLTVDPKDAAIAEAVINLGKCLDVEVLAEGAETKDQIDVLVGKGCKRFQGYYYSRPVPAEDLAKLFSS
ncbi:MAG: EAL domain-containing protein [Alphaproteobacteria bacterium]|nr:EAL domain-containing protein [Alphaproteobacteria bacterium]